MFTNFGGLGKLGSVKGVCGFSFQVLNYVRTIKQTWESVK